jgi:hypothetical protein
MQFSSAAHASWISCTVRLCSLKSRRIWRWPFTDYPPTASTACSLVSNPLKHAFGKARIRCSDVNPIHRMMTGFTSEALSLSVNMSLQIVSAPRPRRSIVNRHPSLILLLSRAVPKQSLYRCFCKLESISHLFSSIPFSCNNMRHLCGANSS